MYFYPLKESVLKIIIVFMSSYIEKRYGIIWLTISLGITLQCKKYFQNFFMDKIVYNRGIYYFIFLKKF